MQRPDLAVWDVLGQLACMLRLTCHQSSAMNAFAIMTLVVERGLNTDHDHVV